MMGVTASARLSRSWTTHLRLKAKLAQGAFATRRKFIQTPAGSCCNQPACGADAGGVGMVFSIGWYTSPADSSTSPEHLKPYR